MDEVQARVRAADLFRIAQVVTLIMAKDGPPDTLSDRLAELCDDAGKIVPTKDAINAVRWARGAGYLEYLE
jgi:hypothetical protein